MKRISFLILFVLLFSFCFAKTKKEEYQNGNLYSTEYFDYLIECAEAEREAEFNKKSEDAIEIITEEFIDNEEDIVADDFYPFQLRIEENVKVAPYKDTFKRVNTKTEIPVTDKFSIIHDSSKTRNKYNSQDHKILTGAEFRPWKFLVFSSGLETNYRDIDQNPASRKLYFSPGIYFGDKVSLKFHNKMNIMNYSSDHDIGLNISPFSSKIMDFGVYSGMTRRKDGSISESINFSTNFYF